MQGTIANILFSMRDVAVVATDKRRRIEAYSPGFLNLVGTKVPGRLSDLVAAMPMFFEDRDGEHPIERSRRPTSMAHQGNVVRDMVVVAYCPDGVRRYLRFNSAPRRSPDGQIIGAITLVQDVTTEHLKTRLEKELRDLLVDTVNHGLRTPLSLVVGHAELIEAMDLVLPPEAQHSMEALVGGARRLEDLTRRVSELVDLAAAGQVSFATIDLADQVRHQIEAFKALAARRGVRLRGQIARHITATVDPGLLNRALGELILNAIEAAPRASTVTVRFLAHEDWVELVVMDSGPGIPSEDLQRLYRPFESGPSAGPASSGRGLGLALARIVATAHGGTLDLQTRQPSGLRAVLRVPRDPVLTASIPRDDPASPTDAVLLRSMPTGPDCRSYA